MVSEEKKTDSPFGCHSQSENSGRYVIDPAPGVRKFDESISYSPFSPGGRIYGWVAPGWEPVSILNDNNYFLVMKISNKYSEFCYSVTGKTGVRSEFR